MLAAAGDGAPGVVDGAVVFVGPYEGQTVNFTYTVSIPGNESVTNYLNASVSFKLASMLDALTVERLPATLLMKRYHSADYRAPFWVIDPTEMNRVKGYVAAGHYYVNPLALDGFNQDIGETDGGRHSADHRSASWVIDPQEVNRVKGYLTAGGYHVVPESLDGYGIGPE